MLCCTKRHCWPEAEVDIVWGRFFTFWVSALFASTRKVKRGRTDESESKICNSSSHRCVVCIFARGSKRHKEKAKGSNTEESPLRQNHFSALGCFGVSTFIFSFSDCTLLLLRTPPFKTTARWRPSKTSSASYQLLFPPSLTIKSIR